MIIGHGMQRALVDPTGVVSVDYFAHKPELGLYFVCHMPQRFHEVKIQYVGSVQAYAVNVKLADPKADHVTDIVPNRRIALVQFRQQIIAPPVVVGESVVVFIVPPEIYIAVPVSVGRVFPVAPDILEGEKVSAGVVEHAVQDYPDASVMAFSHKIFQIFVVSQATVQFFVIRGLIAMPYGLKQRPDVQGVYPQPLQMPDPGVQGGQSMNRLPVRVFSGSIQHPQGIYVIKNCLVIPCHFFVLSLLEVFVSFFLF